MRNDRWVRPALAVFILLTLITIQARAAEKPATFLEVVRKYADTMIERGRDTYGPVPSGLILSALDRMTLRPLTTRPAAPAGVRRADRSGPAWQPLTGANPHLDENLLRILYTLTPITGDPRYAQAADAEIKWFFDNAQSPITHLLPWGEHLSWDVITDKTISGADEPVHEFARPWVLWDRSWKLSPQASKNFALGLWEHQIANHETGGFDRHAMFFKHGPADHHDFPRHAGFYIATWSYAYKYTSDPVFLNAIEVLLQRFERKRKQANGTEVFTIGPLDCELAAGMVPDPLAKRLKAFAAKEDELLLASLKGPDGRISPVVPDWQAGYGSGTPTYRATYCLARYEQVPNPGYREAVLATVDAYGISRPSEDVDLWPMTLGHVISLQVAAYRWTNERMYLDRADRLAHLAVDQFWQDKPIPKASFRTGHYETITGADTLALALLELHAAIHQIKIPIPSNTIDR